MTPFGIHPLRSVLSSHWNVEQSSSSSQVEMAKHPGPFSPLKIKIQLVLVNLSYCVRTKKHKNKNPWIFSKYVIYKYGKTFKTRFIIHLKFFMEMKVETEFCTKCALQILRFIENWPVLDIVSLILNVLTRIPKVMLQIYISYLI